MTSFSVEWLDLREPADHQARDPSLAQALGTWARGRDKVMVVDLGSGTGSTLRSLAPHLGARQAWLLIDVEGAVLEAHAQRIQAWADAKGWTRTILEDGLRVTGAGLDLTLHSLVMDLQPDLEPLAFAAGGLVTASALLDLVSERWLTTLAARCRDLGTAFCAPLNYEGEFTLTPADPFDRTVCELVNRHQRRDKGFGAALGPDCTATAERIFHSMGYSVQTGRSDWHLGPDHPALAARLCRGWADAAAELRPDLHSSIKDWLRQRLDQLKRSRCDIKVAHRDLLALPSGAPNRGAQDTSVRRSQSKS